MFAEPLSAFRQATAANEVRLGAGSGPSVGHALREVRAGHARQRSPQHAHDGSLLRGVPARAYVKRRNLVHTPKHGSWLNIAECERSCLTSQCLAGRRIGCLKFLQSEIATWSKKNNTASIGNSNSKTPEQNSKSSTPKLRPDKAPGDAITDWTSGRCPTIPSSLARAFGSHTRRARGHLQQIPIGIKLWND